MKARDLKDALVSMGWRVLRITGGHQIWGHEKAKKRIITSAHTIDYPVRIGEKVLLKAKKAVRRK